MLFPAVGFPAAGPPLGMCPLAPCEFIVIEALRLCSPGPDDVLPALLPLTIVGIPKVGTAGGITGLPFPGDIESVLPCDDGDVVDAIAELLVVNFLVAFA